MLESTGLVEGNERSIAIQRAGKEVVRRAGSCQIARAVDLTATGILMSVTEIGMCLARIEDRARMSITQK
jgi:hypothetical protein